MDASLLRFITSLRQHELPVSTAETLDALQAAALIGYGERELLRAALAAALAKTAEHAEIFHRCFDQFFDRRTESVPEDNDGDGPLPQPPAPFELPAELSADPAVSAAMAAPLVQALTGDNPQATGLAAALAAEQVQLDQIRFNTQRGVYRRRLLEAMDAASLDGAIEALAAIESDAAAGAAHWLSQRRHELDLEVREQVDRALMLGANAAGREIRQQALRHTRLSALERYHLAQLPPLIRKLAKKLAASHRRRRRVDRRGRLDMGKTLRRNLAYGGVPFHTYWKQTRREQPKIYVLCDISGSVATYSRFLLLFLYSLSEVMPRIRSFVFSNRLAEVSELFERLPTEQAIETAHQRYGMGSSDYGSTLHAFGESCLGQLDSNSTVIILGDGRCNGGDTGLATLRKVYHRAKLVLWFNPEPESHWNTGDSEIRRFQSACHFVTECNSLAKLERLLDQLLTQLR